MNDVAASLSDFRLFPQRPISQDRLEEAANAHSTIEYGYHADFLTLATETVSIDPDGSGARAAASRTFQRGLDSLLRPAGYQLLDGTTVDAEVGYTWHSTHGRLEEVSGIHAGAARNFTYGYEGDAYHLIDSIAGPAHTVGMDWMTDRDVLDVRENKVGMKKVGMKKVRPHLGKID